MKIKTILIDVLKIEDFMEMLEEHYDEDYVNKAQELLNNYENDVILNEYVTVIAAYQIMHYIDDEDGENILQSVLVEEE